MVTIREAWCKTIRHGVVLLVFLPGIALAAGDPWEGFNRGVYKFNDFGDRWVLRPTAKAYNHLPGFARTGVSNVFANVGTPAIALNQALQGNLRHFFLTQDAFYSTLPLVFWVCSMLPARLDWRSTTKTLAKPLAAGE